MRPFVSRRLPPQEVEDLSLPYSDYEWSKGFLKCIVEPAGQTRLVTWLPKWGPALWQGGWIIGAICGIGASVFFVVSPSVPLFFRVFCAVWGVLGLAAVPFLWKDTKRELPPVGVGPTVLGVEPAMSRITLAGGRVFSASKLRHIEVVHIDRFKHGSESRPPVAQVIVTIESGASSKRVLAFWGLGLHRRPLRAFAEHLGIPEFEISEEFHWGSRTAWRAKSDASTDPGSLSSEQEQGPRQ